jgi:hypothetical protein
MPKLVRVKLGKADLAAPVLDHLVDAARREATLLAEPQPQIGRARVRSAGSDVAVNVTRCLGPDRKHHLTSALGDDPHDARTQVNV